MLLRIKNVLNAQQLNEVQGLLNSGEFVDGRLSAGREAAPVKHNEELSAQSPLQRRLNAIVLSSLVQHPLYQQAVLPLRVASAFFARYQAGMEYGFHVDDPVMGPMSGRYRSDVSSTVFLNEPTAYQGGELVIRSTFGEQAIKGEAGDAVIYPSSSWHRVNRIDSGVRLVAVTWAQSMVKDAQQREYLYQLAEAREELMRTDPDSKALSNISTVYANLVRSWSEV